MSIAIDSSRSKPATEIPGHGSLYRFLVASDPGARRQACLLTRQVYTQSGLIPRGSRTPAFTPYENRPELFTLLAEDRCGRPIATVSLVLDSDQGLPCDEVYRREVQALRKQGLRLVEVTRLAISEECRNSRMLLVNMFQFISVFARHHWRATDFVIEVHPHHVPYYKRMLLFEQIGGVKSCPRVSDAPAVLLRLDLSVQEHEIGLVGGSRGRGKSCRGRNLYSWFSSTADEQPIAEFLAAHVRPMISADVDVEMSGSITQGGMI